MNVDGYTVSLKWSICSPHFACKKYIGRLLQLTDKRLSCSLPTVILSGISTFVKRCQKDRNSKSETKQARAVLIFCGPGSNSHEWPGGSEAFRTGYGIHRYTMEYICAFHNFSNTPQINNQQVPDQRRIFHLLWP